MPSARTLITIAVVHVLVDMLISRVAPVSVRTLIYG